MAHRYFTAALIPPPTTMRFVVSYGACSTLTTSQSCPSTASRSPRQTRAEPIRVVVDAGRQVDFLREAVVAVPCPDCQGSGRFDDIDCCNCRGTGAAALEPV